MALPELRHAKILLLDDQEPNLLLLEDILEAGGYVNRRCLTDSREVGPVFQEFQPDLILLDLMMPHLDGVQVMEQLRPLIPQTTYLPILVLTADVTREARRRALSAGASDFLTKPLDEDEVLLRIRNLLHTRFLYLEQQRQAEVALRQREQLLREVTENLPLVLWMVNGDASQALYTNAAYERIWGRPAQTFYQNPLSWMDTIHPGDRPAAMSALQEAIQGKRTKISYRLFAPGGVTRFMEVAAFPITDSSGVVHRIVGYAEDVTEKKLLEGQLRQSQKMEAFGQLAGGVAHDFNNLLTVINGVSELLLSGAVPPEQHPPLLQEIHKAGERASSLTRQLLAFSRKQVLQPINLDLNELIREMEKMLRRIIGEDIELTTSLDPDLHLVRADPGQMEQVILNLVVNARDAMPAGGKLRIETRNVRLDAPFTQRHPQIQPGGYVLVAVSDSGCGMDEATRVRIFEPFFTTKEVGKGTGLGLATVDGIVKQSGGCVEVESELECGTTFRVYLPRIQGAVSTGKSWQGVVPQSRGNETILLAEDEPSVRALIRLVLESDGYTILDATTGEEALQLCQQYERPIHLLLTDVVMPRMNGRQLADAVVAVRPQIRVLYLSGYADDAVVRHGLEGTDRAFLHKPFTPLVLRRKVREVLEG